MSRAEIIEHWRKGARDAFHAAEVLLREGTYDLVLFHCHLAVEKALKAAFIEEHDSDPPPTHDLLELALPLKNAWSEEDKDMLDTLTDYAVSARYSDPAWFASEATRENAEQWLKQSKKFLTKLL